MNLGKRIDTTHTRLVRDTFGEREDTLEALYNSAMWTEKLPISTSIKLLLKGMIHDILDSTLYPKAIKIELQRLVKRKSLGK